jgi:P4 family phage/plasmid primase-like protien
MSSTLLPTDQLSEHHQHMLLEESGIKPEVAAARGYYTEYTQYRLRKLNFNREQQRVPALVIPLWAPDGNIKLHQIRCDDPRPGRKYEFPAKSSVCIDVPPVPLMHDAIRDPNVPLIVTEGSKKADCAVSHGMPCIALTGVWNWRGRNTHGGTTTLPELDDIAWNGRTVYIAFDSDVAIKSSVHLAMDRLASVLKQRKADVRFVYFESNKDGDKVGLDDYFVAGAGMEDLKDIASGAMRGNPQDANTAGRRARNDDIDDYTMSEIIGKQYDGDYIFDSETEQWYHYEEHFNGVWHPLSADKFNYSLAGRIHDYVRNCSTYRAREVAALLRARWGSTMNSAKRKMIPMANGVLNLSAMELEPHGRENQFTWQLPYAYDPDADCPLFKEWLMKAVENRQALYDVAIAFLGACIRGMSNLEVYLEVVGGGGSGKSTFMRVAQALVGYNNTHNTNFKRLTENRFETAMLHGKRLLLLPDTKSYADDMEVFKNITGADPIPYERKYVQQGSAFTFYGMCLITANEPVRSGDISSGITRRRMVLPFDKRGADNPEAILEIDADGDPYGRIAHEVPGIFNYALQMTPEQITEILKAGGRGNDEVRQVQVDVMLETNSLAGWADECLIKEPSAFTRTGSAVKHYPAKTRTFHDSDGNQETVPELYDHQWDYLYASYCAYCEAYGHKNPVKQQIFKRMLLDLLRNQWRWDDVEAEKVSGDTGIRGIRIRQPVKDPRE